MDDTVHFLHAALHRGERILCEGAQGALLDVDHGTYPYVTSSSPISGGATTGLGLPPTAVRQVTGIVKAYCTRVGNGPFPTELNDATGELLRRTGREFGSTTGRPRRCGWLDMVALRYSIMINGITAIAFMKLDVLDELDEIRVCNAYDIDGHRLDHYPTNLALLERVTPVLTSFTGWRTSLVSRTSYDDLPPQARHYVEAVEAMAGVPVSHLSIGPGREQTIRMQPELE